MTTFVELGPDGVLSALVETAVPGGATSTTALSGASGTAVPLLRRDRDEVTTALTALATLHVRGADVDWTSLFAGVQPADLPTYAFQRERYWLEFRPPAADPVEDGFWQRVDKGDLPGLATQLGVAENSLAEVLPALTGWRAQGREQSALDALRYRVTWEPIEAPITAFTATRPPVDDSTFTGTRPLAGSPLVGNQPLAGGTQLTGAQPPTGSSPFTGAQPSTGSSPLTGTWLVLGDTPLTAHLEQLGVTVVAVPVGSRAELAVVLRDSAPTGILAAPDSLPEALAIVQALTDATASVPATAADASGAGLSGAGLSGAGLSGAGLSGARLWLVTRNAVSAGRADGPVDVRQALFWGFGRAVALEHPDLWGGLLDLPADLGRRGAARVVAALAGVFGAEDQIAVRGNGVFVRRLHHAPAADRGHPSGAAAGAAVWQPRGTVLIAGGTGGLGAAVARWAADNGADRLVLVSRRGAAAPGAGELLAALPGAEAHSCDLADREAVAALLAAVGPVDAVVHAAGVSEDVALVDIDAEHLDRVVRGKVDGAIHLDELIGDVDAFIVFSSISGVWGSAQQAAYGAANAALDALIARRRAAGLPGTAVSWGPWAEAGMAASDETAAQLRRRGLTPMAPARALAALGRAVGSGDEAVTVADVRWADFLPLFTASRARPFFDRLPEAAALTVAPEADSG
ncbi:SDR family NAD(P)-dependent oxidoreductase, partial [Actinoplanes derwentensis]|uniref:SDR family NAD(P)-dependent oxidoreductase n=1 Tax=Actinoplanes derwentensis TaxID=113562 RepID=UPI00194088E1